MIRNTDNSIDWINTIVFVLLMAATVANLGALLLVLIVRLTT